jgi:RNA polymerase sigma-70 factor, ECF subfamily
MSMERRVRFELLYGKHAPAVKAYVLRRAAPAVADDLVAEVFVVCWRRFDEIPADPLPWLLGVARRVLSTYRRGERRGAALRQRLADDAGAPEVVGDGVPASTAAGGIRWQGAPGEGTLLSASSGEGGGALREALARLSESDRELLLLIAWEGLSPTQAAAAMGVSAATMRVRLHRARRRLARALLREDGERGEGSERGERGERGKASKTGETSERGKTSERGERGDPLPCTPLTMEAP